MREAGVAVWIDESGIPVSIPWMEEIQDAIRSAALVLTFDSPNWFSSEHCVAEEKVAASLRKRILHVDASADPTEVVSSVRRALAQYTDYERALTEVSVRSHEWEQQGRPRRGLARGRALARYRRARRSAPDALAPAVADYLRRSTRRQVLRWGFAGSTLTMVLLLNNLADFFGQTLEGARSAIGESQDTGSELALVGEDIVRGPLVGLDSILEVVEREEISDGSPLPRLRLISAMTAPVLVPSDGLTEVERVDVAVHSATDRTARLANGGAVVVSQGNQLWRSFSVGSLAQGVAWSPDGRTLAVGVFGGVEVVDVETGTRRSVRGLVEQVTAVAWLDGTTVLARDGSGNVHQALLDAGEVLLDDPSRWVMDISPGPLPSDTLVLSRDGRVERIDLASGTASTVIDVPGVAFDVAAVGDRIAVAHLDSGASYVTVAEADGTGQVNVALGACGVTSIAGWDSESAFVVACSEGDIVMVDADKATRSSRLANVPAVQAVDAAGDMLVTGDWTGRIALVSVESQDLTYVQEYPCPGATDVVRVWQPGRAIVHAGPGVGSLGCLQRGWGVGSDEDSFTPVLRIDDAATSARAVAVALDGSRVAYGFSDGTIQVVALETLEPRWIYRGLLAEIRGLQYSPDGRSLVAATRDGRVVRFDTAHELMSLDELAVEAERHRAVMTKQPTQAG
jgi:WD40 repeat protein